MSRQIQLHRVINSLSARVFDQAWRIDETTHIVPEHIVLEFSPRHRAAIESLQHSLLARAHAHLERQLRKRNGPHWLDKIRPHFLFPKREYRRQSDRWFIEIGYNPDLDDNQPPLIYAEIRAKTQGTGTQTLIHRHSSTETVATAAGPHGPASAPAGWASITYPGENGPDIYYARKPLISIGREADCDVVVEDEDRVSRKHAEMRITPEGMDIRNLSRNGTNLGSFAIDSDWTRLPDNCEVTLAGKLAIGIARLA